MTPKSVIIQNTGTMSARSRAAMVIVMERKSSYKKKSKTPFDNRATKMAKELFFLTSARGDFDGRTILFKKTSLVQKLFDIKFQARCQLCHPEQQSV